MPVTLVMVSCGDLLLEDWRIERVTGMGGAGGLSLRESMCRLTEEQS